MSNNPHHHPTRPVVIRPCVRRAFALLAGICGSLVAVHPAPANAAEPRIVNIYNFIRNSDFRLPDSEAVLFDCTRRQIELLKRSGLPATWALQYDALMNPRYQQLLKTELGTNDEIAAWWEIPQALAEKAGLPWRGQHAWDPVANVGFSPGYPPEARRRLVDVYMADFKAVFGCYPRTVGSWYIDEITLAYLAERYGIVASCNCKDQIGTDFYTLWGGYWNQAYYPSRLNAYMPAQTRAGQINVPIFRMLGSDPIYQHGTTPGLQSLEPVYPESGGSPRWVAWFMNNLVHQPSLAFGYAQAGQENSFGWDAMKTGLTHQVEMFAAAARAGNIRVETLVQTGRWFREHYPLTPATSVVALDDWKNQNRRTVWYDSRFYRLNLLWESNAFFIRDLHCFDESVVSPTHRTALMATSLAYETLPVMDWAVWSRQSPNPVGAWPVFLSADEVVTPMTPVGEPVVKERGATTLSLEQPLAGGGTLSIVCAETSLTFDAVSGSGRPARWALQLVGGEGLKSVVKQVTTNAVTCDFAGTNYRIGLAPGMGSCRSLDDGVLRMAANPAGKLVINLNVHEPQR